MTDSAGEGVADRHPLRPFNRHMALLARPFEKRSAYERRTDYSYPHEHCDR